MEGNKAQTNDTANNTGSVNHYPRDEKVREAVEQLAKAVLESDTYKEFQAVSQHISGYPELKEQVDNYRKDVFMVQTGRMGTVDVLKDLEARSDELHADNLMDDYLNTENAMCKMYQRIVYMLIDKTDFDPGIEI
ncbi:MAG: YlbF family regulator [Lachnospiraceae bacterium]|nr:YlbF family regulator [Lachnospiraceae bacterium]